MKKVHFFDFKNHIGCLIKDRNKSCVIDTRAWCLRRDYDLFEVGEEDLPFDGGHYNVHDALESVGSVLESKRHAHELIFLWYKANDVFVLSDFSTFICQ